MNTIVWNMVLSQVYGAHIYRIHISLIPTSYSTQIDIGESCLKYMIRAYIECINQGLYTQWYRHKHRCSLSQV